MVVMEAENYTGIAAGTGSASGINWVFTGSQPGFSGIGAMQAVPNNGVSCDTGTQGPRLDFNVYFQTAGTYYIWVRMLGPTGTDDSVNVGLDGAVTATKITDESAAWHWEEMSYTTAGRATMTVGSEGGHMVNVWMREDGVYVDKVVLTTNANYTPAGLGPDESPREPANDYGSTYP